MSTANFTQGIQLLSDSDKASIQGLISQLPKLLQDPTFVKFVSTVDSTDRKIILAYARLYLRYLAFRVMDKVDPMAKLLVEDTVRNGMDEQLYEAAAEANWDHFDELAQELIDPELLAAAKPAGVPEGSASESVPELPPAMMSSRSGGISEQSSASKSVPDLPPAAMSDLPPPGEDTTTTAVAKPTAVPVSTSKETFSVHLQKREGEPATTVKAKIRPSVAVAPAPAPVVAPVAEEAPKSVLTVKKKITITRTPAPNQTSFGLNTKIYLSQGKINRARYDQSMLNKQLDGPSRLLVLDLAPCMSLIYPVPMYLYQGSTIEQALELIAHFLREAQRQALECATDNHVYQITEYAVYDRILYLKIAPAMP
jgi:hypothetical protein